MAINLITINPDFNLININHLTIIRNYIDDLVNNPNENNVLVTDVNLNIKRTLLYNNEDEYHEFLKLSDQYDNMFVFTNDEEKIKDEGFRVIKNHYELEIRNNLCIRIIPGVYFDIKIENNKSINDTIILPDVRLTKYQIYNDEEEQYLRLLANVLNNGHFRQTRNSNTWSVFGETLKFDLANGFPLLTTKKVFMRGICEELLFFLRGDTNTKQLSDIGVKIWEPNTSREFLDDHGLTSYPQYDMGPMYGYQLRHFGENYHGFNHDYKGIDQIANCLNLLKTNPYSRRILMTTFNPKQAEEGVLYPCHGISIQFHVDQNHRLSCAMTQRSVDLACGLPFNIASYALLIYLFCEVINNDIQYLGPKFTPGTLIMNLGDVHIYESHKDNIIRQILRKPYPFPQLSFKSKVNNLVNFKYEDLQFIDYKSHSKLDFKMVA